MKKILMFVVCFMLGILRVSAADNDSNVAYDYIDNIYSNRKIGNDFYTGKQGLVYVNGKVAYCLDPTILLNNNVYSSSNDFSILNINSEKLNYLEVVSFFGYNYTDHFDKNYYLATQELIWEYLTGGEIYWTNGKGGTVIDIDVYKNEILRLVNDYLAVPNIPTYIETYVGENVVISDSTLHNYSSDLWLGVIEDDKLILDADTKGTIKINLTKYPLNYESSYIYYSNNSQALATFGYSNKMEDTIEITYKVKALSRIRFIKKDSSNGSIIQNRETKIKIFDVKNNKYMVENGNDIFTIGKTGILETNIYFDEGEYRIEEIESPLGYRKLNDYLTFNIYEYHGDITDVDIYNEPYLFNINITKKGEVFSGFENENDNITGSYIYEDMSGVKYGLYALEDIVSNDLNILYHKDELIAEINIENGFGSISGIPYGKYYLKEIICPDDYILSPSITEVIFDSDENLYYSFYNKLKKGNLIIKKVDGSTLLSNAEFILKEINYSYSIYLKNKTGKITLKDIPYGNYILTEVKAPEGYVLDEIPKEINVSKKSTTYRFENKKVNNSNNNQEKTDEKNNDEDDTPNINGKDNNIFDEIDKKDESDVPSLQPEDNKDSTSDKNSNNFKEEVVNNPDTFIGKEYNILYLNIIMCICLFLGIHKYKNC